MAQDVTTLAGRYLLEEPIARGAMATVWRARDDVLARTVAIKILQEHLAADEGFVERFRQEALSAARLIHPHIVQIYDSGNEDGPQGTQHFIVMEHCGGGTLENLRRREGPFEPQRAVDVGTTIADALGYAHRASVIHRDIKPANVLISDHRNLKVADFGIAKAAWGSGDVTTTGKVLGTVMYISPEQAAGSDPDARSDLYALGVLMYELLTGRPPFRAETDIALALKHLKEEPPPLRAMRAGIPRALDNAVMKALAKDPDDRYRDADEMKEALDDSVAEGRTVRFSVPSRVATPAPPSHTDIDDESETSEGRKLLPVLFFVLIAVVVAVLIATNTRQSPEPPDLSSNGDQGNGTGQGSALEISSVSDFDPHGGDGEHPELVELVTDGDPATFWKTSSYNDALTLIKPGVGLLFDLGDAREVGAVEVELDAAGYSLELRAGDEAPADETALDVVAEERAADPSTSFDAEGTSARYWLVWITGFPGGGGGTAQVGEVRFVGP